MERVDLSARAAKAIHMLLGQVEVKVVRNIIRQWLPLALVVSAFCGLVYLVAQQGLRQGGNDPQIQLAEDVAEALGQGNAVEAVMPANQVDLAWSLAPFVIVYDVTGALLASSGQLHGQVPSIPASVFDYVRQNGEDRVTWQPEPGVRIASVVVGYTGTQSGFVLAGRSLREVEERVSQLGTTVGVTWVIPLLSSLVMVIGGEFLLSEKKSNK
jgi:hypothetical protein